MAIQFNGFTYPSRIVTLPGLGTYTVSTTNLRKDLFVNNQPVTDMAEYVSESVDYYVEPHELELPEKAFKKLLEQQIM